MTENGRFFVKDIMFDGYCIYDTLNDKYYDYGKNDLELLCNVLNKLNEKNELFRMTMKDYRKLSFHFERRNKELVLDNAFLEKENEQLKQQCKHFIKMLDDMGVDYIVDENLGIDLE